MGMCMCDAWGLHVAKNLTIPLARVDYYAVSAQLNYSPLVETNSV